MTDKELKEIRKSIEWGEKMVKAYKEANKQVPVYVYDKLIELYKMLID